MIDANDARWLINQLNIRQLPAGVSGEIVMKVASIQTSVVAKLTSIIEESETKPETD